MKNEQIKKNSIQVHKAVGILRKISLHMTIQYNTDFT